jgi:hypothetical protein
MKRRHAASCAAVFPRTRSRLRVAGSIAVSLCKQEVTGSIPVGSIDDLKGDERPKFSGVSRGARWPTGGLLGRVTACHVRRRS